MFYTFNLSLFQDFYTVKRGEGDVKAIKTALKILKAGKVMGIFPEGSRAEEGKVRKLTLGVGMLAAHSGAEVVPVFVKGTDKILPKYAKFVKFKPMRLYIGKGIKFEKSDDMMDKKEAYKRFSNKVMESIESLKKAHE